MGSESNWSMVVKLCVSWKASPATLYCKADTDFLCITCDSKIHAANKLASRHARVRMCEVCEQSPTSVTCKADVAALCVTCDRDIHSANLLARRHDGEQSQELVEKMTCTTTPKEAKAVVSEATKRFSSFTPSPHATTPLNTRPPHCNTNHPPPLPPSSA